METTLQFYDWDRGFHTTFKCSGHGTVTESNMVFELIEIGKGRREVCSDLVEDGFLQVDETAFVFDC